VIRAHQGNPTYLGVDLASSHRCFGKQLSGINNRKNSVEKHIDVIILDRDSLKVEVAHFFVSLYQFH
jgi:hypothetical protein